MSISDNYDLTKFHGTRFPNEDDPSWLAHGNHTSLPPSPPIILHNPQVQGHSRPIGKKAPCVLTS